MNLPRSTYYHKPNNESDDDQKLIDRIEAIIEEFSGYGYRRVTRELHRRGDPSNSKKVLRIMRERGLIRKPKRRWIRTTNSNHPIGFIPIWCKTCPSRGPGLSLGIQDSGMSKTGLLIASKKSIIANGCIPLPDTGSCRI